jgi:Carboxypeptidase regulatory-like domain
MRSICRVFITAAVAVLLVPGMASAQAGGEIFGRVSDSSGAVMPGVTVTLNGPSLITPQSTVSLESGAYRFPSIPIGLYSVTFEIPGFRRMVRENVRVETGFNAEINASLSVSTVEETVTVSAAGPVVDTRSTTTGQTFNREMLERIPSARDPWVVLEQTAGIIMNQQNVGGNKSGQQSTFIAHGTGNNEVWNVDGGNITDMAASSSSLYFDFDAFEEIQVQTGGSDASVQSSGVSINLVTRSGGNDFRGSSRFYVVDNNLQGDNITPELQAQGAGSGNPIKNIKDYGFEIGGPIMRNKAWFWGSAGLNDIEVGVVGFTNPGGDPDNPDDLFSDVTNLKTYNAKLQYQWSRTNKSTFLYFFNDKVRNARGAAPNMPPETTFRQTAPVHNIKGTHQWIPSNRLTVELQGFSMPNGGFKLDFHEDSLIDVQSAIDLSTNVLSRSNQMNDNRRPQTELRADANYFLTSVLGGDHATKFGVGYRDNPVGFSAIRGGRARARFRNGLSVEADLYRDSNTERAIKQYYGYLQDSYTKGRLTVNAGVRADYQDDEALASGVGANPIIPDLLPAVQFAGADSGVSFFDVSPRLGVTYNLSGNGKTIVKSNYAMYWGTGITTAQYVTPVGEVALRYPWTDLNNDRFVQRNELDLTRRLNITGNYDPANPASPVSPTTVDPNLKNDRTDEFSIGLEHELMENFGVGAAYIYRQYPDYENYTPSIGVRSADYVPVTITVPCTSVACTDPSYTVTYYQLPYTQPAQSQRRNADRTRKYHGLELTARKRFSRRWMMNASANLQTTKYYYGEPDLAYQDPTDVAMLDGAETGTSNARWVGKVTGLYVLPWQDIGISGFFNARQGYPFNRYVLSPSRTGGIGTVNIDIDRWGEVRYDNFYQVDMRVEKQFTFGRTKLAASFDVFNLLNSNVVLSREDQMNSTRANFVEEVLAPRVARFGVRLSF